MAPNPFQQNGAQPQKQPKSAPIFVSRTLTGLYTQRAALHDPSDVVTAQFYGGRPDALWDGVNVELTNKLVLVRRFGTSAFSTATYDEPPTCAFSFHLSDGTIKVLIDTPSAVWCDNQDGTKTLVLTKASGAGQSYFISSDDTCYIGDGVDLVKYTPTNTNGTIWNWGIVSPAAAPGLVVTESGASAVTWQANTLFSTMGLLVDSNNNIQFLTSVDENSNTTQFGTTGDGQPDWDNTLGGSTTDGTCNWTCWGQVGLWLPATAYTLEQVIFDPTTGWIFQTTAGTSGSIRPNFKAIINTSTNDPQTSLHYQAIGPAAAWMPNFTYNAWWEHLPCAICEPVIPTEALLQAATQPIFLQTNNDQTTGHNNVPGTSGSGYTPAWATTVGFTTLDNDLLWTCLGAKAWAAATAYSTWSNGANTFSALVDGNGNFQVCVQSGTSQTVAPLSGWVASTSFASSSVIAVFSQNVWYSFTSGGGTSGSTQPTDWDFTSGHTTSDGTITWTSNGAYTAGPVWGQTYGSDTTDGSVIWANCGSAANSTWATDTIWYLPKAGYAPPTSSQPYGGAAVVDTNSNVQFVVNSGLSGSSQPSWGALNTNTTDNQVTWYADAAFSPNSISWQFGYTYAYSYKCRTLTDDYSPLPLGGGDIPPGVANALGAPYGGQTGAISTASPVAVITGSNNGAVNTITGISSLDPQVDTIVIWRSADSVDGSAAMFELTEIPNPRPVNGGAVTWQFEDYLPDLPTSVFPGLNPFIPAPIDGENDPPPAGFLPLCNQLHFERIFGAKGSTIYFSGGPDVITGNPNEAFLASDDFPCLSTVVNLVHTAAGLVTFLTSDIECVYGGPATAQFSKNALFPGVGLLSYNALDVHGGEIYFLSADGQGSVITPSLQMSRIGFPIGDKLAAFDAASAYVTVHESGTDNAVYFGDGSTGYYRLNPHQVPQGDAIWSTKAVMNNGCQMIQSLETSTGVHQLLIGLETLPLATPSVNNSNNTVVSSWASGDPSFTMTVTPSVSVGNTPINIGDVAFTQFMFQSYPNPSTTGVTSITDDKGNTWKQLGSTQNFVLPPFGFSCIQTFYATMETAIPLSSTITLTVNVDTQTGNITFPNFISVSGIDPTPLQTLQALNDTSNPVSGTITTEVPALLISFVADWPNGDPPLTLPTGWTDTNIANLVRSPLGWGAGYFVASTPDSYQDQWTAAAPPSSSPGNANWATTFAAFQIAAIPQSISKRDLTVWTDLGSPYDANFVIGSIVLAHPGEIALVDFFEADFASGPQPTVSYLLNEINTPQGTGSFTAFSTPNFDPPVIYGTTISPVSYQPLRFTWSDTGDLAECRHLQIKVDFGNTSTTQDAMYNFTIYGSYSVEK